MHTIRQATHEDVLRISEIEQTCFPEAEAATLQSFQERFAVFPECFFVLEGDESIVGHINGCITDSPELPDKLLENAHLHKADGKYQTIFGLAIIPEFQHLGYASLLLQHFIDISRKRGLHGVVLTCKEHLVEFYAKFGFQLRGTSSSSHGGAQWYEMVIIF